MKQIRLVLMPARPRLVFYDGSWACIREICSDPKPEWGYVYDHEGD